MEQLAAAGTAVSGTALAPAPHKQAKKAEKKEKKLHKQGLRTRFSGQIPMDLGLDRRMTITASARIDEDTGATVQFDVVVPPGIQPGKTCISRLSLANRASCGQFWRRSRSKTRLIRVRFPALVKRTSA